MGAVRVGDGALGSVEEPVWGSIALVGAGGMEGGCIKTKTKTKTKITYAYVTVAKPCCTWQSYCNPHM